MNEMLQTPFKYHGAAGTTTKIKNSRFEKKKKKSRTILKVERFWFFRFFSTFSFLLFKCDADESWRRPSSFPLRQ